MNIKINGAQLKLFLEDSSYWGSKIWDGVSISINNGEQVDELVPENVDDTDIVEFQSGYVYDESCDGRPIELSSFIRKWLKNQNCVRLVIQVDASRVNEIKAAVKDLGGHIC